MWSNAGSVTSSSGAVWPLSTTNLPSSTGQRSSCTPDRLDPPIVRHALAVLLVEQAVEAATSVVDHVAVLDPGKVVTRRRRKSTRSRRCGTRTVASSEPHRTHTLKWEFTARFARDTVARGSRSVFHGQEQEGDNTSGMGATLDVGL